MEIERKFLVESSAFEHSAIATHHITQAYLSVHPTVRLRIQDNEAFITIKGPTDPRGIMRSEWEYPIPCQDAMAMLSLCHGKVIRKCRYLVPHQGHTWEVDVFQDTYAGRVIAEIELKDPDEEFALPDWIGPEVTGQKIYYNAYMALHEDK